MDCAPVFGSFDHKTLQWNRPPMQPLDQGSTASADITNLSYQQGAVSQSLWDPDTSVAQYPRQLHEQAEPRIELASSQVTSKAGPKRSDWERYRPKISELYRKKGLKATKDVMEREHQFKATEKMYKKRISDWKIEKNVKDHEMEVILRKTIQRTHLGKESAFLLRDLQVPEHKIARFRKIRKGLSDEQILRLGARTPAELVCYTPLASPLTTPRELETPERIAKLVQIHAHGCFDSGVWAITKNGLCISTLDPNFIATSLEFGQWCYHGIDLLKRSATKGAWRAALNVAMARIKPMIVADALGTFRSLAIMIISQLHEHKLWDIASLLLKQFSAMSAIVKPLGHPFREVFTRLLSMDSSQLNYALGIALLSQRDCFAQRCGRSSWITISFVRAPLELEVNSSKKTESYLRLLRECEQDLGTSDLRCLAVRSDLAREYCNQSDYQKVVEFAQSVIDLAPRLGLVTGVKKLVTTVVGDAFEFLSKAQHHLLDEHSAENTIYRAISIRAGTFGWQDPVVLRRMGLLEDWLEEWNRPTEAAELRMRRERLLHSNCEMLRRIEDERWEKYQTEHPNANCTRTNSTSER